MVSVALPPVLWPDPAPCANPRKLHEIPRQPPAPRRPDGGCPGRCRRLVSGRARALDAWRWRGGRAVEGARLESVYTGNRIEGSNPSPSANASSKILLRAPGRQEARHRSGLSAASLRRHVYRRHMECSAHIARRQLAAIGGLRPRIAHDDLREADRPEPEQLVALIGDGLQDSCMTYRKVDQRVTPLTERSSRACAVATCVARCASACPSATNAIRTEAASPRPRGERRRPVDNVDQQEALVLRRVALVHVVDKPALGNTQRATIPRCMHRPFRVGEQVGQGDVARGAFARPGLSRLGGDPAR